MNKYLEQDIRIKLSKFGAEHIEKEDLEKITELGLNNVTLSDKPKNIDLSEIKHFPNLQMLTLQNFQLGDRELRVLSSLERLSTLHLASCKIKSKDSYTFCELEDLIIDNSEFDHLPIVFLPKAVTINGINRSINLSSLHGTDNIENLFLTNIKKIVNFGVVSKMPQLIQLNIDGSKVDNSKVLEELTKKITVSHKAEFRKIL